MITKTNTKLSYTARMECESYIITAQVASNTDGNDIEVRSGSISSSENNIQLASFVILDNGTTSVNVESNELLGSISSAISLFIENLQNS